MARELDYTLMETYGQLCVLKRGNRGYEEVKFDKITQRIKLLCVDLSRVVDPIKVSLETIKNIVDGISTDKLDEISAGIAESLKTIHSDYSVLASRLLVSNLHKSTPDKFSVCMGIISSEFARLHSSTVDDTESAIDSELGDNNNLLPSQASPHFDKKYLDFISTHATEIDGMIINSRDYDFKYFGLKTLMHNYLVKINGKVCDRPQYMFMRVAIALYADETNPRKSLSEIKACYKGLSHRYFIHATPTLYNACTTNSQLLSCFLLGIDDSIEGIMKTCSDASVISKWAGGIGVHLHNIRCAGTDIRGTKGKSSGLIPQLKIWDAISHCWDQGGKRKGAIAAYLEPSHGDILEFLRLKLPNGEDSVRARNLFYAMWMPDLFYKRLINDEPWSLFTGNEAKRLSNVYDGMEITIKSARKLGISVDSDSYNLSDNDKIACDVYTKLYEKYEQEGRAIRQLPAHDIAAAIFQSQRETGTPYVLNKDHINRKSNQKNVGTIKSSNLCVTADTYILTDKGQFKIGDLAGQEVNVWNGTQFSKVTVMKTGENQKIIRVNINNGVHIDCTEYHKFYIETNNYGQKSIPVVIEAKDLKPNMRLIRYKLPIIESGSTFKYPYTHGMFCADGTYENTSAEPTRCKYNALEGEAYCARHISCKTGNEDTSEECQAMSYQPYPRITLYHEKRKLERFLDKRIESTYDDERNITNVKIPVDIAPKYEVPINADMQTKLLWFAGYLDGDGTVTENDGCYCIQASSIHKEFLLNIRLMLQTIGIDSVVTKNMDSRKTMLPDGRGGQKEYNCKPIYRLLISAYNTQILDSYGFDPHRIDIPYRDLGSNRARYIKVTSIEDNNVLADTYCFNEPISHKGMFNGVLLGNCSEICEISTKDSYACCTLASINLPKYYDESTDMFDWGEFHIMVRLVTRNLNRIVDINKYPVEECRKNNFQLRPIAIGIQGLADLFFKMRVPFLSRIAAKLDVEIMEAIYFAALTESVELAKQYGSYDGFEGSPASKGILQFDLWKSNPQIHNFAANVNLFSGRYDWDALKRDIMRYGLRNSLTTSLMPTASTSQVLGNNESFEPITSNMYVKSTLAGKFTLTNDYMIKHLTELGLYNEQMRIRIMNNQGSLEGIDEIPLNIRKIYRTVWDMPQRKLMKRAAIRSAFIDQSQSLNIYLRDNSDDILSAVMLAGWNFGLKTTSYYIHTKPAVNAMRTTYVSSNVNMVKPQVTPVVSGEACPIGCDSCSG